MQNIAIPYDPTKTALFHPDRDAPVADFSTTWTPDQICAELSRLAYVPFEKGDSAKLAEALTGAGFAEPICFNDEGTGTQGFGTTAGDTAYVAFRGTEIDQIKDIGADLNALPAHWGGEGFVHRGFLDAYESVREKVDNWVAGVAKTHLVVTGHSLGAAVATLMAARHDQAQLVTFGSPRVGSQAFADRLAHQTVRRYVDCVDAVPDVPPAIGYVHVREMIYIDRDGSVRAQPPGTLARLQEGLLARLAYWRKCRGAANAPERSFADHAPINYISAALGRRTGP
ncbi:MAG TPA: lipase family protein [Allosphingosinicella sp.]|nr:lipase family protein [Allosphingosinicella sp.]